MHLHPCILSPSPQIAVQYTMNVEHQTADATPKHHSLDAQLKGLQKCHLCPKAFPTVKTYNRHLQSHTRPYVCKTCERGFALRSDCDRHESRHRAAKALFFCKFPTCTFKGTPRKDNLKRHMRKCHQGETTDTVPVDQDVLYQQSLTEQKESKDGMYLLTATEEGKFDIVRSLIANERADLTRTTDGGQSVLHVAVKNGSYDLINFLVDRKVHINTRDNEGRTALHIAASTGNHKAAQLLLDAGADIYLKDNEQNLPLHEAAKFGYLTLMQLFASCGMDLNLAKCSESTRGEAGQSALHLSAFHGRDNIARYLLERGTHVDVRDKRYQTPLHLASANGHISLAKLLIKHGANVNLPDRWGGRTPLFWAAEREDVHMMELLFQSSADPNLTFYYGLSEVSKSDTLLQLSIMRKRKAATLLLLEHGANVNESRYGDTKNPLKRTVQSGIVELIKFLFHKGADPNLENLKWDNEVPLENAIRIGCIDSVRLLLKHGADVKGAEVKGLIVQDAIRTGNKEILKLLLEFGAAFEEILLFSICEASVTTLKFLIELDSDKVHHFVGLELQDAFTSGNMEEVPLFKMRTTIQVNEFAFVRYAKESNTKAVRLLLENGANVNAKSWEGETALDMAAKTGNEGLVAMLIEGGVELKSTAYNSPLENAARADSQGAIRLLLDGGTDINWRDGLGRRIGEEAVFVAVSKGNEDIARLLLEEGVNVNKRWSNRETALEICKMKQHPASLLRLLLDFGAEAVI